MLEQLAEFLSNSSTSQLLMPSNAVFKSQWRCADKMHQKCCATARHTALHYNVYAVVVVKHFEDLDDVGVIQGLQNNDLGLYLLYRDLASVFVYGFYDALKPTAASYQQPRNFRQKT